MGYSRLECRVVYTMQSAQCQFGSALVRTRQRHPCRICLAMHWGMDVSEPCYHSGQVDVGQSTLLTFRAVWAEVGKRIPYRGNGHP